MTTFDAYQIVRSKGEQALKNNQFGRNGKPLIMRLIINDVIRANIDGKLRTLRVVKMSGNGNINFADHFEANVAARNSDTKDTFSLISKTGGALKKVNARKVTVSPIGEISDPGFKL